MGNLTREEILSRKMGQETVELPSGGTVKIRGLSHAEVVAGREQHEGLNEITCFYVATALIDPAMSLEDVLTWSLAGDAGDITTISERVQALSRLTEGAGKSGVPGPGRRR